MVELEWAYDKIGNRKININNPNVTNYELKKFRCITCKKDLVAKPKGIERAPHFAHKGNHQHESSQESNEHLNAKLDIFDILEKYINKKPFYLGVFLDSNFDSHPIRISRKIQRIDILKNIYRIGCEEVLENGYKPDITLFDKNGKAIRTIEIVKTHEPGEDKIEDLEDIEIIEVNIESPEFRLNPDNHIKFYINLNEIHNPSIQVCQKIVCENKYCRDDKQERLHCIINSTSKDRIFDFEKCPTFRGQNEPRCTFIFDSGNKCNRMLLKTEKEYCKRCLKKIDEKKQKEEMEKIKKQQEEEKKKQIIYFNSEASRLFENERYSEAIEIWEKVLNLDPENREALNGITKAKEAERIKKIDELNEKAKELYKNSKWIEAKSTWEEVLKIDPDNRCAKEGIEKVKKKFEKDKEGFLFSWDEIPGKDSKKLIDFLELNLCIRWIKPEIIKKTDDGNTIKAISGKNSFSIKLLHERTIAILTIDDIFTDQFIARAENNSINIYEEILEIENLDLPTSVKDFYKISGVSSLYRPQKYAVNKNLLKNSNLVAAIPTASGKTLLAEFAMLKSVMDEAHPGKALYIVPLRALASEKYDRFKSFESIKKSTGRGVSAGIATGDFDSRDDWLGQFDIIVATSEKVDSLLRNRSRWMEEITVVVADEIHLIDSPDRGPTLEIVLAKLRQINPNMQIIALSATIGNAGEIAKWLDASLVVSEWRPIVLKEGVFFGNAINFGDGSQREVHGRSRDQAISLVTDTLAEGGQCLIFESSRKNSEGMASRAGTSISSLISGETKEKLKDIASQVRESSEVDTAQKLALCIENGSAFHHAGLISEQRKLIEDGFRSGIIKVISATPTLAAGLNLPARRVIIKGYRRYNANEGLTPIPVLEYKQMAGRAGRPRLDPYGESVLIAKTFDELEELMQQYVCASVENIWSKLGSENALRTHILSTIATGFARSMEELLSFMSGTFYSTQQEPWSLKAVIEKVIMFLVEKKFVIEKNGLFATRLGELVSRLYIDPLSASMILEGMERIEEKEMRYNELTLLHLISKTPDMRPLYLRSNDYEWISDFIMEHSGEFVQIPPQFMKDYEWFLSEVKTACVMLDWINEVKEDQIVKKFGIGEGDIRALSETSLWLVHSMAELGIDQKRSCAIKAKELAQRVEYGASPELLELIQIRGIGRVRARKLYTAGIRSLEALQETDLNAVARIIGTKTAVKVLKQIGRAIDEPEKPEKEEQRRLGDFR